MKKRLPILFLIIMLLLCQSGCMPSENTEPNAPLKTQSAPDKETPQKSDENFEDFGISTGVVFDYIWDSDLNVRLASMTYPVIKLSESTKKQYSNLSSRIDAVNKEKKDNVLSEYEWMEAQAQNIKNGKEDFYASLEMTENVSIRRADSKVLSLLFDVFHNGGGAHPNYYFSGETYSTQSGQKLSLSDVVTDTSLLVPVIYEQLDKFYKDTDLFEGVDIAEIINDEASISWTLDYNGITLYFNPYSIAPFASGMQAITISFDENPDLIKEEYKSERSSFGMQLTSGVPFFFDTDEDGKTERLDFYFLKDEYDTYTEMNISLDDERFTEEIYGYNADTTFVHTENGNFLYVELLYDNDYRETHYYILDEKPMKNGSIDGGMYNTYDEDVSLYDVLINPESFLMSKRTNVLSSITGIAEHCIGKNGEIKKLQENYVFDDSYLFEFTLLTELYVDTYDFKTNQITGSKTLKQGEKVKYYSTDGERYAYLMLSDGTIGRVEVNCSGWPITIGEIDINDIFSGMMFAG